MSRGRKPVSTSARNYQTEIQYKISTFDASLSKRTNITERIESIAQFGYEYIENKEISEYCYLRLKKEFNKAGESARSKISGLLLVIKGSQYWQKSNYKRCIEYFSRAISILKDCGEIESEAYLYQMSAFSHLSMGDIELAFKSAYHAIDILKDQPDSISAGWTHYCLGVLYSESKDFPKALKNYKETLRVFSHAHLIKYGQGRAYNGMGNVYLALNKKDKAEKSIIKSVEIFREVDHKVGLARAMNDLGVLLSDRGEYRKAEELLIECLKIRNYIGHIQGTITTLYHLGVLQNRLGKTKESGNYLKQALKLVVKTKTLNKEVLVLKELSFVYRKLKKPEEAIKYLEKYILLKEQISGDEMARKLQKMESRLARQSAEKEAEIERLRNVELKSAHDIIAEKNKEILSSITYAKRIQEAIMPPQEQIKKYLKHCFILYKPKDIVAGDFYWFEKKGDEIFIAAGDCTGHGVPGAMVSVVCANALNRTVNEMAITEPAKILDQVRQLVIETFERSENDVKDGMDISFCRLNLKSRKLLYSGAHNSLYRITPYNGNADEKTLRNENHMLLEYKGDKQPVGKFTNQKPFTQHEIQLLKGDVFYLSTDGYPDQFGGPDGRKFMYRPYLNLFLSIHGKNMDQQKEMMITTFENWRGKESQVDDICVIGVMV